MAAPGKTHGQWCMVCRSWRMNGIDEVASCCGVQGLWDDFLNPGPGLQQARCSTMWRINLLAFKRSVILKTGPGIGYFGVAVNSPTFGAFTPCIFYSEAIGLVLKQLLI
jgi:hypothetical protein